MPTVRTDSNSRLFEVGLNNIRPFGLREYRLLPIARLAFLLPVLQGCTGGTSDPVMVPDSTLSRPSSVVVTPDSLSFSALEEDGALTATAYDRLGERVLDATFSWTSSNPAIAYVSEKGLVTSKAWGQAFIVATTTCCSAVDTAVVTVGPSMNDGSPFVEVTVDSTSFEESVWVGYSARVVNAHRLGLQNPDVSVTASDPSAVWVTDTALLGLIPGRSWIVGECAGLRDSVAVEVLPTQIDTLLLTPTEASLEMGESLALDVTAFNQAGETVTGRVLTWSSSDPGVADVVDGQVTAVSIGTTIVSAAVGKIVGSVSVAVEVQDPTLTTDPESLQKALEYEQQFWENHRLFRKHVMAQIDPPLYSDSVARELEYSSGMGLAAYHTNDELTALARMIEVARDPARRAAYAEMGSEFLQILVPAIATGQGTEGCPETTYRYHCSPGYFKYIDAAHGAGAAGFIMNAIYEDPDLRPLYLEDLVGWCNDLVPTLERHFESSEVYGPHPYPYMPAKIAPAYLAVGKILSMDRYLEAFERITRVLGASADANGGWIGADVNHSTLSATAISLAYREQYRGTIPDIITAEQLQGIGEGFVEVSASNPIGWSGTLVGPYGLLVRFSAGVAARAGTHYLFSGTPGGHPLARVFATVAGLAGGHATLLASDPR